MINDDDVRLAADHEQTDQKALAAKTLAAKALAFDPEHYRHHIADLNMSEEAQAELMAVMWQIMQGLVDLGFGEDTTRLALNAGDNTNSHELVPMRPITHAD